MIAFLQDDDGWQSNHGPVLASHGRPWHPDLRETFPEFVRHLP